MSYESPKKCVFRLDLKIPTELHSWCNEGKLSMWQVRTLRNSDHQTWLFSSEKPVRRERQNVNQYGAERKVSWYKNQWCVMVLFHQVHKKLVIKLTTNNANAEQTAWHLFIPRSEQTTALLWDPNK